MRRASTPWDERAVSIAVPGVRVGHWTGEGTGVTVLLAPAGSVGAGEVRGGAPATREFALLEPLRTVDRVDAVTFAGGSAFGLAAADGVVRFLAERGQGYPTAGGPVPIVPTAAVFDLVASGGMRPGAEEGYLAAVAAARGEEPAWGRVGAGAGATVGKWRGRQFAVAGGVGSASGRDGDVTVGVVAVVNALGDVVGGDGTVVAGSTAPESAPAFPAPEPFAEDEAGQHTTLVAVATDARLDKAGCRLLAESAHDGLARALHPAHTRFDGDVAVAVATGTVTGHLDRLRVLAADLTAAAIRAAVAGGPTAARR